MTDKYLSTTQVVGGVTFGTISAWFGNVWPLMGLVVVFILLDYVSGIVAAAKNGIINSKTATAGMYKKAGFLLLITMGFALDAVLQWLISHGLKLAPPVTLPFGTILCAWVIFTEAISVTENLHKLGVQVPSGLLKFLKIAQESTDKK